MSKPKSWAATTSAGFALVAGSVLMAFLADHPGTGYEASLFLGRNVWWVQLAGIVLSVVGCIGLLVNLKPRAASLVGLALIATDLLLLVLFDGRSIPNVHSWNIVLLFPLLLVFFNGAMLAIVGSFKLALLARRGRRPQP